jgi:uncharacterized membrane protein
MKYKSYYLRAKQILVLLLEKIKNHSVLLEFYFLKTVGWIFFLFGLLNFFLERNTKQSYLYINYLLNFRKINSFRNIDAGIFTAIYLEFMIWCLLPIIIGSILLLKNKPIVDKQN